MPATGTTGHWDDRPLGRRATGMTGHWDDRVAVQMGDFLGSCRWSCQQVASSHAVFCQEFDAIGRLATFAHRGVVLPARQGSATPSISEELGNPPQTERHRYIQQIECQWSSRWGRLK